MNQERGGAYHHTEACQMLGVSEATLRRLAKHYEDAFELLPTDARGGRVYPDYVLKRIEAARALFDAGRAANLETAFMLLARGGEGVADEILLHVDEPELVEQLLIEFRGMRQLLERMSARMEALEAENRALRLRLEPGDSVGAERAPQGEPKRRWLAWLIERLQRWV